MTNTHRATSEKPLDLRDLGIHHDLIKAKAQDAINNYHPSLIPALSKHQYKLPPGYNTLTAEQQTGLREHQALVRTSVINVRQYMDAISSIEAFAIPLLTKALQDHHGIECDVTKNVIILTTLNTFTGEIESRTTQTLLQAALHNFLPEQAEEGGIPWGSHLWDYKSTRSSDPAPKLINLTPADFARTCRLLNIGQRYQQHLAAVLNPTNIRDKQKLELAFIQHERSTLLLQADMALMNHHITSDTHATLMRFCAGDVHALFDGLPLVCNFMKLDEITFSSMIISHGDPLEEKQRCIVYIPGDPISSVKEYGNLRSAHADLMVKLQDPDYRNFFIHLAPQSQKLELTKRLNHRFERGGRDPLGMSQQLIHGSLFRYLYTQKTQQLKIDARFLAVPTDDINRIALLDRLEHYLDTSLNVLNVAAFFVPGLGEVMAVVFAAQIMGDVYHGIEAWEHNEKDLAWNYTKGVLINLATAAFIGKVASDLARPLPVKPVPLIEEMAVFTLDDGKSRLWKPDLRPFEHEVILPPTLKPNAQGLYYYKGQYYVQLNYKTYGVQKVGEQTYRLLHPRDANAYGPDLAHNGLGAWKHSIEELGDWDKDTMIRRLHPDMTVIDGYSIERMLHACDIDKAELRQIHMDKTPPPALLNDGMTRLSINQDIKRFIRWTEAGDKNAEPQTQLQLLVEEDLWPPTKALRFVDIKGQTIREYGNVKSRQLPFIQILDTQLHRGDLLTIVLESLEPEEVNTLLGPIPEGERGSTLAEKAAALLKRLTQRAKERMDKLFMSRYLTPPMPDSPAARQLLKRFPQLPGPVVDELLGSLTYDEYDQLNRGIRVPVRVAEEASLFSQELRLNRAFEGLYLDYLNNTDTQALILHSLADMPGWPRDVRIEVREEGFDGPLRDHVGEANASTRAVLVRDGGRYETKNAQNVTLHGPDDIYASVLHALTDAQRRDLGFPRPDQGPALKAELAKRVPMTRKALRDVLQMPPAKDQSPLQLARGRPVDPFPEVSAKRCLRSPFQCLRSTPRRIRHLLEELYPTHSQETVEEFLGIDDLYSREGLRRLEALQVEFRALVKALEDWKAIPRELVQIDPQHVRLVQPHDKQRVVNKLIKCWQRRSARPRGNTGAEPSFILNIDGIHFGTLPTLTADFSHVSQLHFHNIYLQPSINTFLGRFPKLTTLSLTSTHMRELPAAVFEMSELTDLHLNDNLINLSTQTAERFSGMTRLRTLNLQGNPLEHVPDFSQWHELRTLNLRDTQITQWPAGVENLPHLTRLDLRENRLTTLPQGIYHIPLERMQRTYLHGNPLEPAVLDALTAYRERLGLRFEARVHAPAGEPHPANLWLDNTLTAEQRAERVELWAALQAEPDNHDFFRVIQDLVVSPDFTQARQQLTQRVWRVLSAAAEDTTLRHALFGSAGEHETCIDRVATVFSRFGYKVLLHEIGLLRGTVKETELVKLIKGRTRLLQLDDIAHTQIDLQQAKYQTALEEGLLTPLELADLKPDPLEVELIYQVDLGKRLELPWQPEHMTFRNLAKITPEQIEEAFNLVLNQEKVPDYLPKKMLEEQPWADFLNERYGAQIAVERAPFEQRIKDIDLLQDKQEQWAETQAEGDSETRKNLANQLKVLADKLGIEEQKVFTGAPMPDEDYYALQLKTRGELDNVLVKLTQRVLDKKPLSPILE